jgi:carbonic anhydrase
LNLGDVFVVRVAGNIVNKDVLASLEYACGVVKAKLIVVLGHYNCGAITAACQGGPTTGHIPQLLEKIKPAIAAEKKDAQGNAQLSALSHPDRVACINVDLVQKQIFKESKVLHDLFTEDKINLVGTMYDTATGRVIWSEKKAV